MRTNTKSSWKDHDIVALQNDMEKQLISLSKETQKSEKMINLKNPNMNQSNIAIFDNKDDSDCNDNYKTKDNKDRQIGRLFLNK